MSFGAQSERITPESVDAGRCNTSDEAQTASIALAGKASLVAASFPDDAAD